VMDVMNAAVQSTCRLLLRIFQPLLGKTRKIHTYRFWRINHFGHQSAVDMGHSQGH
jgi:hypothetical protein